MTIGILGTKVGMTQIFDESGFAVPVTVIKAGPCVITQIKSNESYTYNNIFYKLIFNYSFINRNIPYNIKKFSFFGRTSKFSYPHLDKDIRKDLTSYFWKHNEKLEKLTNLNLSNWKIN